MNNWWKQYSGLNNSQDSIYEGVNQTIMEQIQLILVGNSTVVGIGF